MSGSVPDCDDHVDCTDDWCNEVADSCANIPNNSLCPDDGLFCTGVEYCDPDIGCTTTGCPCGNDCEVACDEENDVCLSETPLAEGVGGKYVSVTPLPSDSTLPQAILLTPDCPGGVARYVGEPVPDFDIDNDGTPDGSIAMVVEDPDDAVFLTPEEWGTPVYVTGLHIVPDTQYSVWADAGSPGNPSLSEPTTTATWRWGDVNNDTYVNVTDIQWIKFGLQGDWRLPTIPNIDLWGGGGTVEEMCATNQIINVSDIQQAQLSLQGYPYTRVGCPVDCGP